MDLKDTLTVIGLLISLISAVIALYALHTNRLLDVKHGALQKELASQQQTFQERLKTEDVALENRRFFPVVWSQLMELNKINPDDPIELDIRKAVNVLESLSLYWQAGIIDKEMVVLSFGREFDELYTQIDQVRNVPGQNRSGHELLTASGLIPTVLEEIRKERSTRFSFKRST